MDEENKGIPYRLKDLASIGTFRMWIRNWIKGFSLSSHRPNANDMLRVLRELEEHTRENVTVDQRLWLKVIDDLKKELELLADADK